MIKDNVNFRSTKDIAALIECYYGSPVNRAGTREHICVEQRLLSYECHPCVLHVGLKCHIFAKVIRRLK